MVNTEYINLLKKPEEIQHRNAFDFKAIIEEYPYFQSARALYLKTLKKQESFKYNNQLKITAAYTTDRTLLFNFITNKNFNTSNRIKSPAKQTINEKYSKKNIVSEAAQTLTIGKPIPFSKDETYSFNQWLQLAVKKPIIRENKEVTPSKKDEKTAIIDDFIAASPKIPRIPKTSNATNKPAEIAKEQPQLMTETLAKVYLEQKKFDSAIIAYDILSLKYPEKSGFFADQIKRIQIIQNNKQ